MIDLLQRATLFALYQLCIALGIAMLPVAVLARRRGVTLPIHHLVERLGTAYEDASPSA